jgi:DNA-binding SARP family transcriptional activator/tetratricopeptide (TPR) repeat protein
MKRLTLAFLGQPEVSLNGQSLSFPTRKTLALLAYLVIEGGMHSRDHLSTFLWPDISPGRARPTLRNCLYQLRTALHGDQFLNIERNALGFNFEGDYHLDIDLVRKAVGPNASQEALTAALNCHRGEFLAGFSLADSEAFDDWVVGQQEHWHRRLDIIFERLTKLYFDEGRFSEGIQVGLDWIKHTPLNETAYRRVMRLHIAAGDQTAAQQTYRACQTKLAKELDVEPSPETKALAASIKDLRYTIDDQKERANRKPSIANPKFSEGVFVGRSQEFGALVELYHRAKQGEPQIATVLGEAGMGKTRLAEEFVAWVTAQGGSILRGRSFESGRQLPYQPLVDALRPNVEAINAPEDYLSDIWLAELSRLLPELLDRYPDLTPTQLDEAAAQTRLYEAITQLTLSLSNDRGPIILFLDDLQWADTASLNVLQYASRRWQESDTSILVLVTVRAEALHPMSVTHAPQLSGRLDELARHLPLTTLSLEPLTVTDTEKFLADLGVHEADVISRWLFDETSGQPFYMVETLADLHEQGNITPNVDAAGTWYYHVALPNDDRSPYVSLSTIPQKIRQIIAARLSRLSRVAIELLAASAVLAQDFTFELLCQVADVAHSDGLRALDELLHSQLLREVNARGRPSVPTTAPYIFAHDKIREVAYLEAGDARRRIFHQRALRALVGQKAPAGRLAHHAQAAGDTEATLRYSLAAGDKSLALFASHEAITHYEQARAISHQLSISNAQLQQLFVSLGRAYEMVGDYERAITIYGELQALAQARENKPLALTALMARTTIYATTTPLFDSEQASTLIERALPLARELEDHAAEAKIQWNLMLLKLVLRDLDQAMRAGEASLAIARTHQLREREAYAWHDLMRVYFLLGQTEKSIQAAAEAQVLWRELDNKALLADNLVGGTLTSFYGRGEKQTLIPQLIEALTLSQEIDNLWNQSYANHVLANIYFELADFKQAINHCEQAIEMGDEAGFMIPAIIDGTALAVLYGQMGHPELGWPWVERALAKGVGLKEQLAAPLAAKAFLHFCQGELDQAKTAIQDVDRYLELHPEIIGTVYALPIYSRVCLALGDVQQALRANQQLLDYLDKASFSFLRADTYYFKGRALLALDQVEDALTALTEARQIAERTQVHRILWEILAASAEGQARLGDEEMAEGLRLQAHDMVDRIASHLDDSDLREGFLANASLGIQGG